MTSSLSIGSKWVRHKQQLEKEKNKSMIYLCQRKTRSPGGDKKAIADGAQRAIHHLNTDIEKDFVSRKESLAWPK